MWIHVISQGVGKVIREKRSVILCDIQGFGDMKTTNEGKR